MNFTIDQRKSFIAERFIRTLKNKIEKYMTSISKNVSFDKIDDIVNEYNNTYHRSIKMKPVDIKSSIYIDFNVEKMIKILNLKLSDQVRISKYKNIFGEDYPPDWSE